MAFSVIFLDFSNALSHHCTVVWVTWPECPKGVKDVIKQAQRATTKKSGHRGAPRLLVLSILFVMKIWKAVQLSEKS